MSVEVGSLRSGSLEWRGVERLRGGGGVVLVGAGTSGAGVSTVAALLSMVAAMEGSNVLLVDGGVGGGAQGRLLGISGEFSLHALGGAGAAPEELLVPVSDTLTLLPHLPSRARSPLPYGESHVLFHGSEAPFPGAAALFARFDVVVVDGGARLDSLVALSGAGLQALVTVIAPGTAAVAASYALIKALHFRFPDLPVEVLFNRQPAGAAADGFRDLSVASQSFLDRGLGLGGSIPEDSCLRAGVQAGMPLQEAAVGSPAVAACIDLSARLRSPFNDVTTAVLAPRPFHWR